MSPSLEMLPGPSSPQLCRQIKLKKIHQIFLRASRKTSGTAQLMPMANAAVFPKQMKTPCIPPLRNIFFYRMAFTQIYYLFPLLRCSLIYQPPSSSSLGIHGLKRNLLKQKQLQQVPNQLKTASGLFQTWFITLKSCQKTQPEGSLGFGDKREGEQQHRHAEYSK